MNRSILRISAKSPYVQDPSFTHQGVPGTTMGDAGPDLGEREAIEHLLASHDNTVYIYADYDCPQDQIDDNVMDGIVPVTIDLMVAVSLNGLAAQPGLDAEDASDALLLAEAVSLGMRLMFSAKKLAHDRYKHHKRDEQEQAMQAALNN
jgi:hypothetical protein